MLNCGRKIKYLVFKYDPRECHRSKHVNYYTIINNSLKTIMEHSIAGGKKSLVYFVKINNPFAAHLFKAIIYPRGKNRMSRWARGIVALSIVSIPIELIFRCDLCAAHVPLSRRRVIDTRGSPPIWPLLVGSHVFYVRFRSFRSFYYGNAISNGYILRHTSPLVTCGLWRGRGTRS